MNNVCAPLPSLISAGEPAWLDLTILQQLAAIGRTQGSDPAGEVVRLFIKNTPRRLAELTAAIDQRNATGIESAAHALAGGCGQVGARQMAHLAGFIEREAQDGITNSFHIAQVLLREFEVVRQALLRMFPTAAEVPNAWQ
jgi:HPt (histidine-containing phosphotransfer) domain-containing protein